MRKVRRFSRGQSPADERACADSTPQKTQLGATLTITFPVTSAHPQPPPPFTVSVSPVYHTKHHARLACIAAAFREGLVGRLEPYKREREEEKRKAQEERKKREEERRAERERGVFEMPRAGTVKYEDLVKLAKCVRRSCLRAEPLKWLTDILSCAAHVQSVRLSQHLRPAVDWQRLAAQVRLLDPPC